MASGNRALMTFHIACHVSAIVTQNGWPCMRVLKHTVRMLTSRLCVHRCRFRRGHVVPESLSLTVFDDVGDRLMERVPILGTPGLLNLNRPAHVEQTTHVLFL